MAEVTDAAFNFEAEFSLLDIGATSSLLRAGRIRPTVLVYREEAGMESVALDWDPAHGPADAFEDARRFVRDLQPTAYAIVAHALRNGAALQYLLPTEPMPDTGDVLTILMRAADGLSRVLVYPIRRTNNQLSFGIPEQMEEDATTTNPLSDVWRNPYCSGDLVRFRARDRAVDPSSSLWHSIVELTRMRIHDDQANSEEYMSFLDDLRNGVFLIAGRTVDDPLGVRLKPRTLYNPLGTLAVAASRLTMEEQVAANLEKVAAS